MWPRKHQEWLLLQFSIRLAYVPYRCNLLQLLPLRGTHLPTAAAVACRTYMSGTGPTKGYYLVGISHANVREGASSPETRLKQMPTNGFSNPQQAVPAAFRPSAIVKLKGGICLILPLGRLALVSSAVGSDHPAPPAPAPCDSGALAVRALGPYN